MPMKTWLVESGEEKVFKHDIDALEWAAAGLVTLDPPGTPEAEKTVIQPAEVRGMEAAEDMSTPDVRMGEVEKPPATKKRAPRRRSAS